MAERFGVDTPGFSESEIDEALTAVRTALRITNTKLYDHELMVYVQSVSDDLINVGIRPETISLFDFKSACIAYAKSLFGNSGMGDKQIWSAIYKDHLKKFKLRGDSDEGR